MTIDLWMLVAAAGLQWALILTAATPSILGDMSWALGNRETEYDGPAWSCRAKRASDNMAENLPLFAVLVLAAHVSGLANETSALGAEIFLGARVVHAGIYIAGVPAARTLIWAVSIVGMAMVGSTLFG
jgi:uncharacterized MAPEG superfamily protein